MLNASLVSLLNKAAGQAPVAHRAQPRQAGASQTASYDPGLENSGSSCVTFNVNKFKVRTPNAPIGSLAMLFEPVIVSRFADCGVTPLMDAPSEAIPLASQLLGKNPPSAAPANLQAAVRLLGNRRYVKRFDSETYLISLPNGDVCLTLAWFGDSATFQARDEEVHRDIRLGFFIPRENLLSWFDKLYLPKDFTSRLRSRHCCARHHLATA